MKRIKFLICALLCICISLTTLCGCIDHKNLLNLIMPEKKSQAAIEFEALGEEERAELVATQMKKAFFSGQKTVEYEFDCSEYLFDAYKKVCTENPQLFWLTRISSYQLSETFVNKKIVFKPTILLKDEEIKSMQSEIDAETKKLLAGISKDASDYEKVLYIHDYLVDNSVYDTESAEVVLKNEKKDFPQSVHNSTTIYGCLVTRLAICSGYSASFQYLADKLGLESIRVGGEAKEDGESHQWNCVKVDGDYYYIDVTWDDKVNKDPSIRSRDYEFFLINEDELLLTHTIEEGQNVPECTKTNYNYFVYNGLYMQRYSYFDFVNVVKSKMPTSQIAVKFGSADECEKAFKDLFEGYQRFWYIPGVGQGDVMTCVSESGKILTIEW